VIFREDSMTRFVVGDNRSQSTLFPERMDDYLGEDNPVRAVDVFVDELDLAKLGFGGVEPEATGRPAYHPATLLKIYVYGYLNRVQSSRRLERECQRNIELVWLIGRLMPDFKTIADFRKDNGEAIRRVCREFVVLCRRLEFFSEASVAIDGSKFKAVNTRDRNFTQAKMQRRLAQIDESIARYLSQLAVAGSVLGHPLGSLKVGVEYSPGTAGRRLGAIRGLSFVHKPLPVSCLTYLVIDCVGRCLMPGTG
jgi:transposase